LIILILSDPPPIILLFIGYPSTSYHLYTPLMSYPHLSSVQSNSCASGLLSQLVTAFFVFLRDVSRPASMRSLAPTLFPSCSLGFPSQILVGCRLHRLLMPPVFFFTVLQQLKIRGTTPALFGFLQLSPPSRFFDLVRP